MKRIYKSGAFKRKLKNEKEENNKNIIKKTKKISSIFETRPLQNDTAAISNITNEKEVKTNEPSVIDTQICLNATSTADEEYLDTSTLDNFEITQNTPNEMTKDIGL